MNGNGCRWNWCYQGGYDLWLLLKKDDFWCLGHRESMFSFQKIFRGICFRHALQNQLNPSQHLNQTARSSYHNIFVPPQYRSGPYLRAGLKSCGYGQAGCGYACPACCPPFAQGYSRPEFRAGTVRADRVLSGLWPRTVPGTRNGTEKFDRTQENVNESPAGAMRPAQYFVLISLEAHFGVI